MDNNIIAVDKNTFQKEVLNSEKLVLVDFWASWCNPCRMVSPIINQIANEHKDDLKVVKVNVDENDDIATKYEIISIPSILLFKGGEKIDGIIGARPKQMYEKMIKENL